MPTTVLRTPDGVDLHVVSLGDPRNPPLLLLHGGPAANHDYLLPAFATLSDQYYLVLFDQRGGGKSRASSQANVGWQKLIDDIQTVADAFSFERFHLLGYSFGGLLSLLFAQNNMGRLIKLVLVSSAPPWDGYQTLLNKNLLAKQQRPFVQELAKALELSEFRETHPEIYRQHRFALLVSGYFHDPKLALGLTPFRVNTSTEKAIKESLSGADFRKDLQKIDAGRTLLIHGREDPLPVEFAQETAQILGARLEILPRCGHVPYVEAPEVFFAIVRRFLAE